MTQLFVGERNSNPTLIQAARTLADAEVHLRRVLALKKQLVLQQSGAVDVAIDNSAKPSAEQCSLCLEVLNDLFKKLERLHRYERRAFSRRKFALRTFQEADRA